MPIVVDKEKPSITIDGETISNVYVEYNIPEKYKKLCTLEFLTEFRNQLFRMHKYYALQLFADEGIPINTSTFGWFVAFGKACLVTHNEQLLDYYIFLDWYDSDLFDSELAELLIASNLILDDVEQIAKRYNIDTTDLGYCCECGNTYHLNDVEDLPETHDLYDVLKEKDYTPKICVKCVGKSSNILSIQEEVYKKAGSISNLLCKELKLDKVYKCKHCGNYYVESQGKLNKDTFECFYCLDYKDSTKKEYETTDYYRDVLQYLDAYVDKLKEKNKTT